jgi:hypothetical protein
MISTVAALSSSSLVEAKQFGKQVVRLLPERPGDYIPVSVESLCSVPFWAAIFEAHGIHVQNRDGAIFHRSRNRLRQVWNSGWGYPFFLKYE